MYLVGKILTDRYGTGAQSISNEGFVQIPMVPNKQLKAIYAVALLYGTGVISIRINDGEPIFQSIPIVVNNRSAPIPLRCARISIEEPIPIGSVLHVYHATNSIGRDKDLTTSLTILLEYA